MSGPVPIAIAATTASFLALMLLQTDMGATVDARSSPEYAVTSDPYLQIKRVVLTLSPNPIGLLLEGPQ
jgi:hypothetical protein